jgi:hypothetical protein
MITTMNTRKISSLLPLIFSKNRTINIQFKRLIEEEIAVGIMAVVLKPLPDDVIESLWICLNIWRYG